MPHDEVARAERLSLARATEELEAAIDAGYQLASEHGVPVNALSLAADPTCFETGHDHKGSRCNGDVKLEATEHRAARMRTEAERRALEHGVLVDFAMLVLQNCVALHRTYDPNGWLTLMEWMQETVMPTSTLEELMDAIGKYREATNQ